MYLIFIKILKFAYLRCFQILKKAKRSNFPTKILKFRFRKNFQEIDAIRCQRNHLIKSNRFRILILMLKKEVSIKPVEL